MGIKKGIPAGMPFSSLTTKELLLLVIVMLLVSAHELINPTGSVNKFHLTGIEGVRGACDFKLYYGVLNSIYYFRTVERVIKVSPFDMSLKATKR
jgi:hypothetical protein